MKKENIFELLREWKGFSCSTNMVYVNEREFYHFYTLHNMIRYEKERTIAKCRYRNKRMIKNWAYRREKQLSFIPLLSRFRGNKKTVRSKLSDGNDDRSLSLFKKINDYI